MKTMLLRLFNRKAFEESATIKKKQEEMKKAGEELIKIREQGASKSNSLLTAIDAHSAGLCEMDEHFKKFAENEEKEDAKEDAKKE